jgi:hypothetical protein
MIRLTIAAITVIALIVSGVIVAGWRHEALGARRLKDKLAEELDARVKAQRHAAQLTRDLQNAEAKNSVRIKEVVRRVVVNRSPDCAIGPDALRLLNDARASSRVPDAAQPDDGASSPSGATAYGAPNAP